jgi:exodeoxyribonuclease-3
MKILSFNVNGFRSIISKNKKGEKCRDGEDNVIEDIIYNLDPDIMNFQEIKCADKNVLDFKDLNEKYPWVYVNCSTARKGYSGVACFSKVKPLNVYKDFSKFTTDDFEEDFTDYDFIKEGRLLTLEFTNYYIVNCYTVNSKQKLERLEQRTTVWEPLFRKYINKLQEEKAVIVVGDLNVAHTDKDIYSTTGKNKSAGFTKEEREQFDNLLEECGLIDTFRHLHPTEKKYTYFSNFAKSRERNKGWRIDYALVSKKLVKKVKHSDIYGEWFGSDHTVIMLDLQKP